jgi:hypothetical protein
VHADDLLDLALAVEATYPFGTRLSAEESRGLAQKMRASALYIERIELELAAASANVDHMRGVSSRQIELRVEAQARAGRLARDARR